MKIDLQTIFLQADTREMGNALLDIVLKAKNHIVGWKLSGKPVHRRTGTLARSIQEKRLGDLEYELGSYGVVYAETLEYHPRYAKYNYWFAGGVEEALSGIDTEKKQYRIVKTLRSKE